MQKNMRVYLTSKQWNELCVDEHPEFVRCAFYMALPVTYIAHRVKFQTFETDRKSVIESAHELGITDEDVVVLIPGS